MSEWGRATFGDPCEGCGFGWSIPVTEAREIVEDAPRRLIELVGESPGGFRHPDLAWPVSAYVCHVADSIRIWAERIASVALGDSESVAPYDQDDLAAARHYDDIDIAAALWSLERAVLDWREALTLGGGRPFQMRHNDLGDMSLEDVIAIRAHDVAHHARDIERILARHTTSETNP